MKVIFLALIFLSFSAYAQNETLQDDDTKKAQKVEASCGMCNFGLEGDKCELAVRIDGKAYYVDGTKIGDHGDAHAEHGMCKTIRHAEVVGEVVDGRFKAAEFKLLPLEGDHDHGDHQH